MQTKSGQLRTARIVAAVLLLSCLSLAQSAPLVVREQVCIDVLFKHDGAQAEGLSQEMFRVSIGRSAARVVSVQRGLKRPRTTILLDSSGSMGARQKWDAALDLASAIIKPLANDSDITLIAFSDARRQLARVEGARAALENLESMRLPKGTQESQGFAKGRTATRDAIIFAMNEPKPEIGDAIVLITDGGDNISIISQKETLQRLLDFGVRLFAFRFGNMPDAETNGEIEQIQDLVSRTGANLVQLGLELPNSPFHLTKREEQWFPVGAGYLARRITYPYLLTVDVPPEARGKLRVDLVSRNASFNAKQFRIVAPEQMSTSKQAPASSPPS